MKVTSLRDMESYLFLNVILPLKKLNVEAGSTSSPITTDNGEQIQFAIQKESIMNGYDHNYQRDEARRLAKDLIVLSDSHTASIVADYESKRHTVRIYRPAFDNFTGGKFLCNKLVEAFESNTPFTKVTVLEQVRDQRQDASVLESLIF